MLNKLQIPKNSRKNKKRVGRGVGSNYGKTASRGHKGQNARSGGGVPVGFEGGQMPLYRRLPKRGFFNKFREENFIINLETIAKCEKLDFSKLIDKKTLMEAGLVPKNIQQKIKILAKGEFDKKIEIQVDAISKNAREKIEKLQGKVI